MNKNLHILTVGAILVSAACSKLELSPQNLGDRTIVETGEIQPDYSTILNEELNYLRGLMKDNPDIAWVQIQYRIFDGDNPEGTLQITQNTEGTIEIKDFSNYDEILSEEDLISELESVELSQITMFSRFAYRGVITFALKRYFEQNFPILKIDQGKYVDYVFTTYVDPVDGTKTLSTISAQYGHGTNLPLWSNQNPQAYPDINDLLPIEIFNAVTELIPDLEQRES